MSQDRQTEFVGVFAGTTNRFVEVRYGRGNEALPATIQRELPELNQVRRCLGSLGRLLCVATLDDRGEPSRRRRLRQRRQSWRGVDDGASAVRLRAFQRNGLRRPHGYLFFTLVPFARVPGLEVLDPSLQRWVCPEAIIKGRGPPRARHARRVPGGGLACWFFPSFGA